MLGWICTLIGFRVSPCSSLSYLDNSGLLSVLNVRFTQKCECIVHSSSFGAANSVDRIRSFSLRSFCSFYGYYLCTCSILHVSFMLAITLESEEG